MVAEQCLWRSTEKVEDLLVMGRRSGEMWLEKQNPDMPLVVEQWLEVPKILPQDRVLDTARQIANHLDKRDRMISYGKSQLEREVGCLNIAENGEKLKSLVDECAAKVVDELQRKMNIETSIQLLDQTGWTVLGGRDGQ